MSLGYPSLRPQPREGHEIKESDETYGLPQSMLHGFQSVKNDLTTSHPLEYSEEHWNENRQRLDAVMLRNLQGVHAPLRIAMEKNTANKIQRLPCLHSSNLMHDILTGKADMIDFDDFLSDPSDAEIMGKPHGIQEKKLGLL